MRKLAALLCVAAFALAAAGCGSSSGSEGSGDDPTTTKAGSTTTEADATTSTDDDGGDGGDVEATDVTEDEYVTAFATGLSSGSVDDGELVLESGQAECVAPKVVELATVEALNEAGITAEDAADPGFDPSAIGLDEEQAQALIDVYGECDFDIYGALAEALTMGLDDAVVQCTAENIDTDLANAMLVKTFSTGDADPEFEALLTDLQATCDLPAA